MTIVALKVNGRGFTLGGGNGKATAGEMKEIAAVGGGKTDVTQGMNKGEIDPVFIERGGIAIGKIKGAACARGKGETEVADKGKGRLVARVDVNGYGVVVLCWWQG